MDTPIIKDFLASILAVFISMNVLGTLPIYISYVEDISPAEKVRIVNVAILFTFLITITFVVIGKFIFLTIGIETYDFLIAGGLVLIVLAILMMLDLAYKRPSEVKSFAIVPLATPLLAGPGLLTTSLTVAQIYGYYSFCLALLCNLVISWLVLNLSSRILGFFGREGIRAVSKIASLLLASLGVMMIRKGILEIASTVVN